MMYKYHSFLSKRELIALPKSKITEKTPMIAAITKHIIAINILLIVIFSCLIGSIIFGKLPMMNPPNKTMMANKKCSNAKWRGKYNPTSDTMMPITNGNNINKFFQKFLKILPIA